MRKLYLLTLALAFTGLPVLADTLTKTYDITGSITDSTLPGANAGDELTGILTISGSCETCFVGSPGITSLVMNLLGMFLDIGSADFPTFTFDRSTDTLIAFLDSEAEFGVGDWLGTLSIQSGSFSFTASQEQVVPLPEGDSGFSGSFAITAVPEPSTLLLVATTGLALLVLHRRKPKLFDKLKPSA